MIKAKAPPIKAATDRSSAMLMIVAGGLGALSLLVGSALGVVGIAFAAFVGVVAFRQRIYGRAIMRTHAALQAITRGEFDEAEMHLAAMPAWVTKSGSGMRSARYQRALIAFYRNDAKTAAELLGPATATKTKMATYTFERMQRTIALSLRALAFASMGDAASARADIAQIDEDAQSTPEALARARLAEAVLLSRAGEMDALATHFRTHGSLMLEHTFPRERVLGRALRKMVQSRTRSVYREAARLDGEEATPKGAIGEWIAQIAPDAAQHATEAGRLAERAEIAPPAAATDADLRAVSAARAEGMKGERAPRGRFARRVAALWLGLVSLFVALFMLFDKAEPSRVPRAHATHAATSATSTMNVGLTATLVSVAILFVTLVVSVVFATRRGRRIERNVLAAQRAIALGDMKTAEPILVALEKAGPGLGTAQALFLRARRAEQQAQFEECLALCNRALGSIAAQTQTLRMLASTTITPMAIGLRGVALAALGRFGEANAELATIARDHGTWSHRVSAELRIRLMLAVRRGDLETARAVARERTPELPVTLRDEALADLVLAVAPSGASRDEQERVDTELREDMTVRSWIDTVAPDLREDLARRVSSKGVRIDVPDPANAGQLQEDETDEDLESEAAFRRA